MIKTLRITSVLAGMLAIAFLGISVVYGTDNDPEVDELLKAPSAVEEFEKNKGENARKASANTKSPLVVAAETLAKLINPPRKTVRPPVKSGTKIAKRPTPKVGPKKVSAKFKLVGTCYSDIAANRCAFIDEPGQGQHWVKESDKIGHMTIKEIKDGVVVVHNGQGLEELLVEEADVISLMDDGKGTAQAPSGNTKTSNKSAIKAVPGGLVKRSLSEGDDTSAEKSSVSSASKTSPPVRRAGQSQAAYQAALRAYRAKQARNAANNSPQKVTRRPISTNQDVQEFESIVKKLRDYDPTAGNEAKNRTPDQIQADERTRKDLIERMTAQMRKGNLRGNQPSSLGNRNEQLGGSRSVSETE
jgi:hypothetical protein